MKNVSVTNCKAHNSAIDLLRFVMCLAIVAHHFYLTNMPAPSPFIFNGAWILTEAFFILSGVFMAESCPTVLKGGMREVITDSARYIFKKVSKIYPYFFTAFVIEFFAKEILSKEPLVNIFKQFVNSIWTLLLVYMLGFHDCGFMGVTWYISAMLIAMAFLYPLIRTSKTVFTNIIAPVIVLIAYISCDMYSGGNMLGTGNPRQWMGVCYTGTMRAFGGIALGVMVWSASKCLSDSVVVHGPKRIALTALEVAGYAGVIYMVIFPVEGKESFPLIIALAALIALTKSNITYSGYLPERLCRYLGRLSLSVYLCQLTAVFLIWYIANNPWGGVLLPVGDYHALLLWYIVLTVILGIVVDVGVTAILKKRKKLKRLGIGESRDGQHNYS